MIDAKEITRLVGKPINDAAVQSVLAKVPGRKKREKSDSVYHTTYRDYGLELVEEAGRVGAVILHVKSRAMVEYGGTPPEGLRMAMVQDEVRSLLGEPDREVEGLFDQWDRGRYLMTVFYKKGLKVEFINLAAG